MRQAFISVGEDAVEEFGMREFFSLLREAGPLDTEILSCEGTKGVARVRVENELNGDSLDSLDCVEWWEEATKSGPEFVYLIGFNAPDPPEIAGRPDDTLPVEHLQIDEEGYTFDITGSHEAIGEFMSQHKDSEIDITLEGLQGYSDPGSSLDSLTKRQREVLQTAYELGYYDIPRGASTQEVAEELGVDDSTVSEHLQRAERNLLSDILDR